MLNNRTGRRRPAFLTWLATCGLAAIPAAGIVGGLQLWSADGRGWLALALVAVLALTSVLGIVWQTRARGMRRLRTAMDAYAEREIARDRRR
jgi:hypothetical protein